jgi:hypothetical protein
MQTQSIFWRAFRLTAIGLFIGLPIAAGQSPPPPAPRPADVTPPWGTFPKPDAGIEAAGELVSVDQANRRLGLRLDGDFNKYRYWGGVTFDVQLLPYGEVWYHGAPADLADVPLGTRLHGRFLLPPAGTPERERSKAEKEYLPLHERAVILEDGMSHERRRGRAFRIDKLDIKREERKHGNLTSVTESGTVVFTQVKASGEPLDTPPDTPKDATYTLDASTHIWKGRCVAEIADLAVGQIVQVNLTWTPEWGNRQFHCLDIWIDEESCRVAAERQRERHLRRMRNYWLPGWIDTIDYEADAGAILKVTLFAGMDRTLYEEITTADPYRAIAVSDENLRSYWQDLDYKGGHVRATHVDPSPPQGSSGTTLEIHVSEILEGFRPGRFVRIRPRNWPNVMLPPEFRRGFPE